MANKQAILFAGQGAQYPGMGKDLADAHPECRALFTRANEVLGYDLSSICFQGPEAELVRSDRCQPAVFVVGVACYTALRKIKPDIGIQGVAGLSLGEWTALHIAKVLSFDDALRILESRGRFMQVACDERKGAMVSIIGLSGESLKRVAAECGVEIANINSPEQSVLSGEQQKIETAKQVALKEGAKHAIMLNVAGAYHSSLMASAATRLEAVLRDVKLVEPRMPVLSNVTGEPHSSVDTIRRDMIRQITSSVQWVSCIRWFQKQGITRYVECGPGKVLSGLVKRIDSTAVLCQVQDMPSLAKTAMALSG